MQKDIFDVLDQLLGLLTSHIATLLSQPVTGTDDALTHVKTRRSYVALLTNILSSELHGVFISERELSSTMSDLLLLSDQRTSGNRNALVPLLEDICKLAEDTSDPSSQKAAFAFLGRCVQVWCPLELLPSEKSGQSGLPGFEHFVYERLVPVAFSVLSSPQFNPKDGQMLVVSSSLASMTLSQFVYVARRSYSRSQTFYMWC